MKKAEIGASGHSRLHVTALHWSEPLDRAATATRESARCGGEQVASAACCPPPAWGLAATSLQCRATTTASENEKVGGL